MGRKIKNKRKRIREIGLASGDRIEAGRKRPLSLRLKVHDRLGFKENLGDAEPKGSSASDSFGGGDQQA